MAKHTNETVASLRLSHWSGAEATEAGEVHIAVFTGDESQLEPNPVCLEFPDNEPCLSATLARELAAQLILAAALADEAKP
jgi:hypothetical protein